MSKTYTAQKAAKPTSPQWQAFRCTPNGPVRIDPPTPEEQQRLSEQQAALFFPDGQFRRVAELREEWLTAQSKLK